MSDDGKQRLWLPEHADNPFCTKLPPPKTMKDQYRRLRKRPEFSKGERDLPSHLRRFCVLRLRDYMDPLGRQLQLAEGLDMAILSGYVGRNPASLEYRRGVIASSQLLEQAKAEPDLAARAVRPANQSESMIGFAVLGCPGMGKTATVERVLSGYPPTVEHNVGETITQIPYLKIECPSVGSTIGFCFSFFKALDDRLNTNFTKTLNIARMRGDMLMLHVQHYAYLFALGVLVVDEIQHLRKSKQGPESLMNFFVAMSNAIKVPIVLVGTMAALDIVQLDFRSARRATGVGSQFWDRLQRGDEWDEFVGEMWSYQWTRVHTEYDAAVSEALYDESQGVIDIVLKLFIFAQLRVIARAELDPTADQSEAMTPELIREVAAEDLQMIRPMIEALRSNDRRAIERFDDLKPLARHLADVVQKVTQSAPSEIRQRLALEEATQVAAAAPDSEAAILGILKALKVTKTDERRILAEIRQRYPHGDIVTVCAAAAERAVAGDAKLATRGVADRVEIEGDLRAILAAARENGRSGYDAFVAAGVARHPVADLAA